MPIYYMLIYVSPSASRVDVSPDVTTTVNCWSKGESLTSATQKVTQTLMDEGWIIDEVLEGFPVKVGDAALLKLLDKDLFDDLEVEEWPGHVNEAMETGLSLVFNQYPVKKRRRSKK